MARILISWIGTKADFMQKEVNRKGPNFEFHTNFYENYDKHVLLTSENERADYSYALRFYSALKKTFPGRIIDLQYMDIPNDDVVNFNLIHSKVYPLLLKFQADKIDIFISPGTPTMQVVWHIVHLEMKIDIRLLQTIKPEDSKKKTAELIEVEIQKAPLAEFLIKHENTLSPDHLNDKQYCITESLKPIYNLVNQIALSNKTTVLIRGETGTGKEHIAKQIHNISARKNMPYIAVNCAAIGPDLLESRLFGYEKGAFTHAVKSSPGYFQAANGGTIFLDEIGDINLQMQISLLRVLQSGEIQKIGNEKIEKANVRVIAATNKDLYEECKKDNFRWDLYYRLCVAEIVVPPLRERGHGDIDSLISYFNHKIHKEMGKNGNLIRFDKSATKVLHEYSWPGNIRELENMIERFYAYGKSEIMEKDLPYTFVNESHSESLVLNDVVKHHVQKVVSICNGNTSKAKKILGIGSINTVKKYLNK